jgi:hypothetical protein
MKSFLNLLNKKILLKHVLLVFCVCVFVLYYKLQHSTETFKIQLGSSYNNLTFTDFDGARILNGIIELKDNDRFDRKDITLIVKSVIKNINYFIDSEHIKSYVKSVNLLSLTSLKNVDSHNNFNLQKVFEIIDELNTVKRSKVEIINIIIEIIVFIRHSVIKANTIIRNEEKNYVNISNVNPNTIELSPGRKQQVQVGNTAIGQTAIGEPAIGQMR